MIPSVVHLATTSPSGYHVFSCFSKRLILRISTFISTPHRVHSLLQVPGLLTLFRSPSSQPSPSTIKMQYLTYSPRYSTTEEERSSSSSSHPSPLLTSSPLSPHFLLSLRSPILQRDERPSLFTVRLAYTTLASDFSGHGAFGGMEEIGL